jgi:kinesin family protein 11
LAEHGAQPDTPTGTTPRKRVWQYVDQWELTKSRGELLQTWREIEASATASDTFLAQQQPLREVGAEEEEDGDAMAVDEVMSPLSESGSSGESPAAVSLASSASSIALPPPSQVAKKGVGSRPRIAPLADMLNVCTRRGGGAVRMGSYLDTT